jgi:NAD(P)-dependent dehydrogenase (short-subunit alcohol dehydrogenase family)
VTRIPPPDAALTEALAPWREAWRIRRAHPRWVVLWTASAGQYQAFRLSRRHRRAAGHFRLIQAVIPGMRAAGHGRIVIIASGWGVIGHPNATAYAASKAGLIALTKGLGRELGPQGILANAIAPSYIDTEQLRVDAADAGISLDEMRQRYRDLVPVRRLASPDDIAAAVSFLAGPGSSAVVGQVLQPSGGVTRTRA